MADAQINPDQLRQAVDASLSRVIGRDPKVITGPVLVGIIAYPDKDNSVSYKDLPAGELSAGG
ncbi:MAG: hypothetical protein JWM27_467 [Gemmatimonadetes bacterium]|nr:hypothetical protein [Gemmatimonadota bacterium]